MTKVLLLSLGLVVVGNYLYHSMGLDWLPSLDRWNRKVAEFVPRVFRQVGP